MNIPVMVGVVLVQANQANGQALVNWSNWCRSSVSDEENGEIVMNQLFAPNGKTIAYLLDLRQVPERFERQLYAMVEQAKKAGDPPLGLEWLNQKNL